MMSSPSKPASCPTFKPYFAASEVEYPLVGCTLLMELRRLEEAPWADVDLTSRKLAWWVGKFGVKPGRNTPRVSVVTISAPSRTLSIGTFRPKRPTRARTPTERGERPRPASRQARTDRSVRDEKVRSGRHSGQTWQSRVGGSGGVAGTNRATGSARSVAIRLRRRRVRMDRL